ncbi:hypothetical protein CRG98_046568, partial [Punica granatum]
DYSQQRPSQELIAKDLHSLEWKFRHIYWGQPRRHLLTTGWSAFVNKKKLVSGDAVLFLRGEDGELRLGIRRAAQVKGSATHPSLRIQHLNQSALMEIPKALSVGGVFNVYYDPRSTTSHFIIPYRKFFKSLDCSFTPGMRFKMRFEGEDASEQRYSGFISGVSDIDPIRWPGSKWRCLTVRWDNMDAIQCNRICPWEIESCSSVPAANGFKLPGSKWTWFGIPPVGPEYPVPNGFGAPDFGESYRFQKVLQGQENSGFDAAACNGMESQNRPLSELRRNLLGSNGSQAIGTAYNCIGFGESFRFHKVLQGQETFPRQSYGKSIYDNEVRADRSNLVSRILFQGRKDYKMHVRCPSGADGLNLVGGLPWPESGPGHCRIKYYNWAGQIGHRWSGARVILFGSYCEGDASWYLLVGPRCFDDQGGLQRTLQRNALILHG